MNAAKSEATILFVDDEPLVCEALVRALSREPYRCLTAASAGEGEQILGLHAVDVVVSDEQMPGTPGSHFLARVRAKYPHTIRIMLSGRANLDSAVRAINEGEVHRFFLKPCNPADLLVTIRQALMQRRLAHQSRRLLRKYQQQAARLATIESNSPGLLRLNVDQEGVVIMDESDADCDVNRLLSEIERAMSRDSS